MHTGGVGHVPSTHLLHGRGWLWVKGALRSLGQQQLQPLRGHTGSIHRSNKERVVGEWCPLVSELTEARGLSRLYRGLCLSCFFSRYGLSEELPVLRLITKAACGL